MDKKAVIIRPAKPEDWDGIVHVHHEAIFGKASAHYTQKQMAVWAQTMTRFAEDATLQESEKQKAITLVAERDGRIVGFASVVPSRHLLKSVYTAPGNGPKLGERLLHEIEQQAAQQGAGFLQGETAINAVDFYRRHGYDVGDAGVHKLPGNIEIPCYQIHKKLLGNG